MTWLARLCSSTVRQYASDLARTRAELAEATEALRELYRVQQSWKARALAAEVRLAQSMRARHPSCRQIMSDDDINEFEWWLAQLPETEDK